jgi:hypothetical protein
MIDNQDFKMLYLKQKPDQVRFSCVNKHQIDSYLIANMRERLIGRSLRPFGRIGGRWPPLLRLGNSVWWIRFGANRVRLKFMRQFLAVFAGMALAGLSATPVPGAGNRVVAWGAGATYHPADNNDYGQSIVPASLTNQVWSPFPLQAGQGGSAKFNDPSPATTNRFYRVSQW